MDRCSIKSFPASSPGSEGNPEPDPTPITSSLNLFQLSWGGDGVGQGGTKPYLVDSVRALRKTPNLKLPQSVFPQTQSGSDWVSPNRPFPLHPYIQIPVKQRNPEFLRKSFPFLQIPPFKAQSELGLSRPSIQTNLLGLQTRRLVVLQQATYVKQFCSLCLQDMLLIM